jgi:hypothetical protein
VFLSPANSGELIWGVGPTMTASSNRWTPPIGGSIGKIVKLGQLPINPQLQAFCNVLKPHQAPLIGS